MINFRYFCALTAIFAASPALAEEAVSSGVKFGSLAAGLAIAIAALGGALGQGKAVAAALEGISRNPSAESKIKNNLVLGLALIESLVLLALIIAFTIYKL
ncbi:MAG: ATP synthase F0 subunit C [Pseudomonadota bacterium]|nr:ATP synthase F0 subunit C [Pseudomonadota bacterium]